MLLLAQDAVGWNGACLLAAMEQLRWALALNC
jgi:hypothetical protein